MSVPVPSSHAQVSSSVRHPSRSPPGTPLFGGHASHLSEPSLGQMTAGAFALHAAARMTHTPVASSRTLAAIDADVATRATSAAAVTATNAMLQQQQLQQQHQRELEELRAHLPPRTKIIATIGSASQSIEKMRAMVMAGMNGQSKGTRTYGNLYPSRSASR